MTFYDTRIALPFTAAGLRQRGLSDDSALLASAGIFPLRCDPPDHDERLYSTIPSGIVVANGVARQEFAVVPRALDEARTAMKQHVASIRWRIETGGIEIPGFGRVPTALEDQNRVATSIQGMERAGLAEVDYKLPEGWARLTLGELIEVGKAITAHVEACFARERALHVAIDAAQTIAALAEIPTATGWPGEE